MLSFCLFYLLHPLPPTSTLLPYTTLFRSISLHDHLVSTLLSQPRRFVFPHACHNDTHGGRQSGAVGRSEEHTSELQSHSDLVCRLLLEKKKKGLGGTEKLGCSHGE